MIRQYKKTGRVLLAKCGLDGHDRGIKVIVRALCEVGLEVIYTGLFQTPETIVKTAIEEDVDVIGISILSGAHMTIFPRVISLLREKGAQDIQVVGGGIIPDEDAKELVALGVKKVFGPGISLDEITAYIKSCCEQRRL